MLDSSLQSNPELNETGRTLAVLALERLRNGGSLPVRQRETLRRALASAGEALDWSLLPGERVDRAAAVREHVTALAELGARTLERDLARQLKEKRAEISTLEELTRTLRTLAEDDEATYPAELEYAHTGRDGQRGFVTRTETLVLADAGEASTAADRIEKKLDNYAKLRDQMLEDLEQDRRQLGKMREGIGTFVAASDGLVLEVLAVLT